MQQLIFYNKYFEQKNLEDMKSQTETHKQIIIIGGGLSGLTAAQEILKKLPQAKVTVLQANEEVGGRTCSRLINGAKFDLGGTWIGKTQKYATSLAERAQNQLVPQFHQGRKILDLQNKISSYTSNIPLDVGIPALIHMQFNLWKLDRMAKKINPLNPRNSQLSFKWDSQTVRSWMDRNIYFVKVKLLFECAVRAVLGAETDEVSFLFFLLYIRQNGGIQNLINIENGLQQRKMIKGAQQLSIFLQKQIQKRGGSVKTKCYVKKIHNQQNKVTVIDAEGNKQEGDYLIVAMPPARVNRIQFEPQLSRQRRYINERNLMGSCTKVLFLYSEAFWKKKGFSGETLSDCVETPIFNAYDDSRFKQNGQLQPAIVVFMNGSVDREWSKNKPTSQKIIVQTLATYFKSEQMLNPVSVHWKVWNEQKSINGAPIAFFPPGVLTKIEDIRAPEGRIHWAGTEMARQSQGFMDGAIQSGLRAAQQIINIIKQQNRQATNVVAQPSSRWYKKIINSSRKWIEWL